ncbi:hypothetical protein QDZ90_005790, partial [Pluralibacter gergoviae]|nr:hypothetical protein [Pluralibacter gergoviae]
MLELIECIDLLKKEIALSGGRQDDINKLNFIRKIATYLSNSDVDGKVSDIIKLANTNTGYSEYRIINDCESDNRELWVEY